MMMVLLKWVQILDINERLNEKNGNGAMGFLRGVPD
jgi:hypothetical protein